MIVDVHFKHMDSSDSLRDYATDKSEKFKKYLDGKLHITWNFSREHGDFVAHCHIVGNHIDMFGEGDADDAYATVDMAISRLEKQLKKHKDIVTDHHSTMPPVREDSSEE